jgi:ankyrin repeat protein
MAKEMPPKSFPIDDEGNKICAKCNTRSGCTRPVMDQHNSNLRSELFEVDKLYTYDNMAAWIENALNNQRCIWGVHKAISKDDSVQFKEWFNRPENNGFKPYDSTFVLSIVKELLTELYTKSYKNDKAVKGSGLKLTKKQKNELIYHINAVERAYMDMDGAQVFHFMVDCDRDNPRCNERREFDGDNHQHPYELEGTEIDKETYAEVADLRRKCIDMGLDAKTGPQRDLDKTMSILRKRIDEHANKKSLATASRKKNEERSDIIKDNKSTVKNVAGDQLSKHMGNACSANDIAKVLSLINRGANANVETPRGMRPLLVVIVNNGNPDQISKVIKGGAYINACNRLGLTALMLACRLRDTRLVHLLLQNGADEVASEGRLGQGRTALHYCALHSAEDEARAMYDYTKDGEDDDPMRMVRFLDFQDKNGDTPLMVAARNRNGLMCFNLLKLGADPKIVNSKKQSAAYIAREYSYGALADFLDTKMASGVASIETFSDLQFEKVQRFGGLKLMELIQQYCNKILKLLQGRNNVTILMCPSRIQEFADMYGDHEKHQLVNRYFFFILMQQPNNADTTAMIDAMKKIVQDIVKVVREGNVYPSVEALEKPLPWTALMCAATLNDARSMRLICHEGADPNYQNRHGMTALMLAAQLNNIEAICELLLLGSDINLVDNEGYNAYAYSISLPYAKPLQRSSSNVITDGDNDVTKRYTADEVLKMAVTLTPVEIKVRVKANLKKCTAVEIKREMDRLKLLEKNGLSKVKTEDDLHHNVASSHWRIDPEASLTLFGEDCYGDSDKKMSVQDAVKKLKEHDKKKGQKPRCPICTLALPCKHFKKESQANEYARKKEREDLIAIEKKKAKKRKDEEDEDEDEEDSNKHSYKERSNALYEKEDNDVSENENLRMQLEIEKERAQILADRLEKEENESDGLNNLPPRTPVKVKLRRQLHEEQQKSKELANKLEEKKNA